MASKSMRSGQGALYAVCCTALAFLFTTVAVAESHREESVVILRIGVPSFSHICDAALGMTGARKCARTNKDSSTERHEIFTEQKSSSIRTQKGGVYHTRVLSFAHGSMIIDMGCILPVVGARHRPL